MGEKGLRVSYGKYVYEHVPGWGSLPDGWEWNHAVGVAVDGQDRIFVYNRSAHPIIVLDTKGNVINHWGEGSSARRTTSRRVPTAASIRRTLATIRCGSGRRRASC